MRDMLLELLTDARNYYAEHGGAKFVTMNERGEVCALGALAHCDAGRGPWPGRNALLINAEDELGAASFALYDDDDVARVNDADAHDKTDILAIYDEAIRHVQSEVNK